MAKAEPFELSGTPTYVGPPIDDAEILSRLPADLRRLLHDVNGYIAYGGGLHLRGACHAPEWHSLRAAWLGDNSIHRLFPTVGADDVPWAEDALGDQFLLRGGVVHRLEAETGSIESLAVDLAGFDERVRADPIEYLRLAPLVQFHRQGGSLHPGQLLSVYPPYCVAESARGVSLRAIAAADRLQWLSTLAREVGSLPDGAQLRIEIARPPSTQGEDES
jgi:hypothetical protein